jgi:hypothetical protein
VRIYGHYPVIDGPKTTFYRHPIYTFDFTALDGKEKWTAYKFTSGLLFIDRAYFRSLSRRETNSVIHSISAHQMSEKSVVHRVYSLKTYIEPPEPGIDRESTFLPVARNQLAPKRTTMPLPPKDQVVQFCRASLTGPRNANRQ